MSRKARYDHLQCYMSGSVTTNYQTIGKLHEGYKQRPLKFESENDLLDASYKRHLSSPEE